MAPIKYTAGYKYSLHEDYVCQTPIAPGKFIQIPFITLMSQGELTISKGYAWDGPSGPVLDSPEAMRSSLVHDAFYQLLRYEKLSQTHRKKIDQLFRDMSIEDGVARIRAYTWYASLRMFGMKAANPESRKTIHTAP
jgi:hypothetical protein